MVYIVKEDNFLRTFFSAEDLIEKGYTVEESYQVTDEDYNAVGGTCHLDGDQIKLGESSDAIIKKKIRDLKKFLNDTDYVTCKIVEGDATVEDYRETIEKRREARREIDKLEER